MSGTYLRVMHMRWIWLVGLVFLVAIFPWKEDVLVEISSPQGKLAPNLWQEWKWSFPDAYWDPREADAAEREARLHNAQSQNRLMEGTWTQHGPLNLSGRINAIHQGSNPLQPTIFVGPRQVVFGVQSTTATLGLPLQRRLSTWRLAPWPFIR